MLKLEARPPSASTPESIQLDEGSTELVVGRSKRRAHIVLDIPASKSTPQYLISRRHAKLRRLGSGWAIVDLNSVNGVSVNDVRLAPGRERALENGDLVCLGHGDDCGLRYRYVIGDARRASDALAQLRCPPCNQPLACAIVLPCGHALDELCFLERARDGRIDCPMCGALIDRRPYHSPHIDAAVEALLDDPHDVKHHNDRVHATAALRDDLKKSQALPAVLADFLADAHDDNITPDNPIIVTEKNLTPPWHHYDALDDDDLVCDGCAERGHRIEDCPHRSDISDDDDFR